MCTHFAIFVECIYDVWWTQKWRCEIDGAKVLTMEEEKDLFTIEMLSIILPSCWCDGSDDFMFLDYHFTKLVDNIYIYIYRYIFHNARIETSHF
jgi:hypothetical protein